MTPDYDPGPVHALYPLPRYKRREGPKFRRFISPLGILEPLTPPGIRVHSVRSDARSPVCPPLHPESRDYHRRRPLSHRSFTLTLSRPRSTLRPYPLHDRPTLGVGHPRNRHFHRRPPLQNPLHRTPSSLRPTQKDRDSRNRTPQVSTTEHLVLSGVGYRRRSRSSSPQ